jgi:hypothetical protein
MSMNRAVVLHHDTSHFNSPSAMQTCPNGSEYFNRMRAFSQMIRHLH